MLPRIEIYPIRTAAMRGHVALRAHQRIHIEFSTIQLITKYFPLGPQRLELTADFTKTFSGLKIRFPVFNTFRGALKNYPALPVMILPAPEIPFRISQLGN